MLASSWKVTTFADCVDAPANVIEEPAVLILNFICVAEAQRSPSPRRVGCAMRWLLTKVPLVSRDR
jgi:hypothetical protein